MGIHQAAADSFAGTRTIKDIDGSHSQFRSLRAFEICLVILVVSGLTTKVRKDYLRLNWDLETEIFSFGIISGKPASSKWPRIPDLNNSTMSRISPSS